MINDFGHGYMSDKSKVWTRLPRPSVDVIFIFANIVH